MKTWAGAVGFIPILAALMSATRGDAIGTSQISAKDNMVLIKQGTYIMGSATGAKNEQPLHSVSIAPFWIDKTLVTNAEFERFIQQAGYKTDAEKRGGSLVYRYDVTVPQKCLGADWRHPDGPNSSIVPTEPVCQVSWNDANAFAKWANKRLPTEAEWEYAARGGLEGKTFPWGDDLSPGGKACANIMGDTDGYQYRSPVRSFPSNGYGLYDMAGNVWQMCSDYYSDDYYSKSPGSNPSGPSTSQAGHVLRGGSWYCGGGRCQGFFVASRGYAVSTMATNNQGFRCAMTP